MLFSFRTILVPVDFTVNTDLAIYKAIEVADRNAATIYLLHVVNDVFYNFSTQNEREIVNENGSVDRNSLKKAMEELKLKTERQADWINIETLLVTDASIKDTIADKAAELQADLVVIGKKSSHWFNFLSTVIPDELAEETGIPVMTVKRGAVNNRIRTVVVPIGEEVPHEKMKAISALCINVKPKIHLVTYPGTKNRGADSSASSLLQVYQWLRQTMHCQVDYHVLSGHNRTKALLDYVAEIDADLLLVYPETESRTGWMKRNISDVLPIDSKLQVLACSSKLFN